MTRQYIGARYVPIIDGEYNSEKVYEPLTIVTYNGSSYTSKKSVPAGTLPTNTEYWALTGNYNAQIEQYRQDVENYKEDVDSLHERVVFYTQTKASLTNGDYTSGDLVRTCGYYSVNDGGGALYEISTTRVSNLDVALANGLFAHIDESVLNVLHYGVSPSLTDNTTVLQNVIIGASRGAKLYIPSGEYNFSGSITINKPLTITGDFSHYPNPEIEAITGTILRHSTVSDHFILVCSDGTTLQYLNIVGAGVSDSVDYIGVKYDGNLTEVLWEVETTKVSVANFTFGFAIDNLLVSVFKMCHASNCKGGFRTLGTASTSLTFLNCWARNCTGSGFELQHTSYSALINCASDSNAIGYYFNDAVGVSMMACGAEYCTTEGLLCGSAYSNITINSMFIVNCTEGIATADANQILTMNGVQIRETSGTYSMRIFTNTTVLNCFVDKSIQYNNVTGTLQDSFETRLPIVTP